MDLKDIRSLVEHFPMLTTINPDAIDVDEFIDNLSAFLSAQKRRFNLFVKDAKVS